MDFLSVKDVSVAGRRVLVRVDFNVPLTESDAVADDSRIRAALPTIRFLREHGAKTILVSHLGRPGGRRVPDLSLAPVVRWLSRLLDIEVRLLDDVTGRRVKRAVESMEPGDIVFLENVRFHPGETENDPRLARDLAGLADIYVNDAFGTAHRMHASTYGVAEYLPGMIGLLMEREIETLTHLREGPQSPYVAVLGGAKISDKLAVCRELLNKVDALILGGGLANTFLLCLGYSVGKSLVEPEMIPEVRSVIAEAGSKDVDLLMPLDVVVAEVISPGAETRVVSSSEVPRNWSIVDIGPRTATRYAEKLQEARTVFWNGPMGIFEISEFSEGTERMAESLARLEGATTVVGGGESVEAIQRLGLADRIDFVSTAGGAALSFLAGRQLPSLQVLQRPEGERRPWIGGNWKMNTRRDEARQLARDIAAGYNGGSTDVVLFPPHPFVESVGEELTGTSVGLGGQDSHWEDTGAFTGAVSALMLRSVGARTVLVGHSECREHFGDDDDRVHGKLAAALEAGMSAVLCVGETLTEREEGNHFETVTGQLEVALKAVPRNSSRKLVVAYEPVWAIGTGRPALPRDINEMTAHLRTELQRLMGPDAAGRIRVVYGGSITPGNIREVMELPEVDGALVGGASLRADSFLRIIRRASGEGEGV